MASRVDVINSALSRIGAKRIANPDADVKNANLTRVAYDDILESLLRSHAWNFATKRAKLAQLSDVPVFGFDHAYAVPTDWLRTVSVSPDSEATQSTIRYKMELVGTSNQRTILASVDDLYMRYVALITDVNLWVADFKQAMIFSLARDMAIPIASSNELHDKMDRKAISWLSKARSSDAMGATPERRPRGSWITRRGTQRPNAGTVAETS